MSEEDDALRDMARNRGCRLVRSRRRKPGGDFGRYGLKDLKSGKEVFGFAARGLAASASEIERFLRGGAAASWRSSLGASASVPPSARAAKSSADRASPPTKAARKAQANPPERAPAKPKPFPEPTLPPAPVVRDARPRDAAAIAAMVVGLGYEVTEAVIRRNIARFAKAGTPLLVADLGGAVACLTWHVTPVVHRPKPVGRITMLVVAEASRGQGLGSAIVSEAEARLRRAGCGIVEVTSNLKRMRAHAFYERLDYKRTSYRFGKDLVE